MLMTQAMRWFGPADPVSLSDIRQAGASEVVTALHEVPTGEVWAHQEIRRRREEIETSGLGWTVVESLPVHEDIKTCGGGWQARIDAYVESLRNLAASGITVVTYNFMPLLDWTRTDLAYAMPDGALALRFDWVALAAYDLHILRRPGAIRDYAPEHLERANRCFEAMSPEDCCSLERNILAGLPGSTESFTSAEFLQSIVSYADIDADRLRGNHLAFLRAVCPVADTLGMRLVVHPDDPPFPIFGLPRVVSTEFDLEHLFGSVNNASNGLCFCSGSLGARPDNDLPAMLAKFASRVGFLHLRSVQLESERTFHETAHLEGNAQMERLVTLIHEISTREKRSIPMRPDHGHQILDDLNKITQPGYSLLGRMRGLAELRGLEVGIAYCKTGEA